LSKAASRHPFSADRPIKNREEDILGRRQFAEAIAEAIQNWKSNDSLVIGLYGEWGSGKTSIVNMALDALKETGDRCPYIVQFNPWQLSGQGELILAFFHELTDELRIEGDKKREQLLHDLQKYGAYLSLAGPAVTIASATGLIDPGTVATIATGVGKAGSLIKRVVPLFRKGAKRFAKSLNTMKLHLQKSLKSLDRPVLIVVDDIDRLEPDEMRLIFRLVKTNVDFPKLVFLLSFQRDTVEKALTSNHFDGSEYLKKIIQVGFDVPELQRIKREEVLFARLHQALGPDNLDESRFDINRWQKLYDKGLKPFFKNLRDVYRYTAMLEFHIGLLTNQSKLVLLQLISPK